MTDLAGFVTARLDELEGLAEAAEPWPFKNVDAVSLPGPNPLYVWAHVTAHDPLFTLRWVAAMRKIVEDYEMWRAHADREPRGTTTVSGAATGALLPAVRALAAVWDGHPDYP